MPFSLRRWLSPFLPIRPFQDSWTREERGLWGEEIAARFLLRNGFHLLAHRWTLPDRKDIDLVAANDEHLLFVEVKVRDRERAAPWDDIHDQHRIDNLRKAVGFYLHATHQNRVLFRIDGIIVFYDLRNPVKPAIEWEKGYINGLTVPGWKGDRKKLEELQFRENQ